MKAIDPELAVNTPTLIERLSPVYRFRGVIAALFLVFAAIALLLASIGLYAVMADAASRRTQEIGIRMALGASGRDIKSLVFRQGMLPLLIGLIAGLVASLGVNRLLQVSSSRCPPFDPATYAVTIAVLMLAAALGCWIPARRAVRVDPAVALRHE